MRRCPICFGWIHRKAAKCKHCQSLLDESSDCYDYLSNGFARIERECDAFDEKAERVVGAVFRRHEYTEAELMQSSHLDKIRSIAGKMGDDVRHWRETGSASSRLQAMYDSKVELLQERMDNMVRRLKQRRATVWEKIAGFFMSCYRFIFDVALKRLRGLVLPALKTARVLPQPFRAAAGAGEADEVEDYDEEDEGYRQGA